MKKTVLIAGAGAAVLVAGIAFAQGGKHGERMFQRVDANGDGQITLAESQAFRADRFQKMDANSDGAVSLDEMRNAGKRKRSDRLEKRFAKLDTNGNGAIEQIEFNTMAESRFERVDANGDGALTLDEIKDHRQKHHKRRKDG